MSEAVTKTPLDRKKKIATAIALVAGVAVWIVWFGRDWRIFLTLGVGGPSALLIFAVLTAVVAMLPPVRGIAMWLTKHVDAPSPQARRITVGMVAVLASAYLAGTAVQQHRPRYPTVHDEFSYLIGAQQLAGGRLWMPMHPLAKFFDSFQLIVDPVYAPAYFPGTGVWFAVARIAHVPSWIAAAIASGVVLALLYLIVTELLGGSAGFLACVLLLSAGMFRTLSIMVMSQVPVMLAALLAVLAWMKWRKARRGAWAFALGLAVGWACLIRPVDAICFCLPIGIATLADVLRTRALKSLGWMAAGVAPMLLIQLISNIGVTGHVFETPFRYYADRDHPLTSFGFHQYDPSAAPVSDLPQKRDLYFNEYMPQIIAHTPGNAVSQWLRQRLRETVTFRSPFPFPLLLPLMLVGLVAAPIRTWVVLAALPLFVVLYACYVFFMPHYPVIVAPAVIVAILCGMRAISEVSGRHKPFVGTWLGLVVLGTALAALPQFDSTADDRMFDAPLLARVNEALATLPHRPAVVLFRYDPHRDVHEEPVYNADVAWPDDAPVIRAHDRGDAENVAIFRYYAEHQPQRAFYRFNEASGSVTYLGSARELAARTSP
jgi:hypothetical protein